MRSQEQYLALVAARRRKVSAEFAAAYAKRAGIAGIEGTISQGVRSLGLRRSRYAGLTKTHLKHVLTAAALNVVASGTGWPTHRWLPHANPHSPS